MTSNEIPRRCRMDQWTPTERAIDAALQAVENMPADVRLTDAVVLLKAAQNSVADFIDGINQRRYVTEQAVAEPQGFTHLASAMRKMLPAPLLEQVIAHLDPLTPFLRFLRSDSSAGAARSGEIGQHPSDEPIAHICTGGSRPGHAIRPYPTMLCSLCRAANGEDLSLRQLVMRLNAYELLPPVGEIAPRER